MISIARTEWRVKMQDSSIKWVKSQNDNAAFAGFEIITQTDPYSYLSATNNGNQRAGSLHAG